MSIEQLAEDYQEFRSRRAPTAFHMMGEYAHADTFEDASRAGEDAIIAELDGFAARAAGLDWAGLDHQQRITRDMIAWEAGAQAGLARLRTAEFSVDPIAGPQAAVRTYVPMLSLPTAEVAEAMLGKYAGIAQNFADRAERLREGLAAGRTPAAFAVQQVIGQLDAWLAAPLADDPLLQIGATPDGVNRADLLARLEGVVDGRVRPALATYRAVLAEEVAPAGRPDERCGLVHLPGGEAIYDEFVRFHTTTDLTAREIHEIGLAQIESLAREYAELGPQVVGTSDVAEVLRAMREDPALHYHDGDAIVAASAAALAKAKQAMGTWFSRFPKSDCSVMATTSGARAFYYPPARDGSRGGTFFVNVTEPDGWGTYFIEAMTYHESIPGHHLQLGIAAELDHLPAFRQTAIVTAYAEGWGLYTERLADEMGLYQTPLDRLGMLAADSLRACRLVVDTGMHALGWSRQQAIDYMVANSAEQPGLAAAEIDRYATTPGQALAYMIGRLEILRIRREARERLGERFDIRAFHDAVLDSGSLPLPVLDAHVAASLG